MRGSGTLTAPLAVTKPRRSSVSHTAQHIITDITHHTHCLHTRLSVTQHSIPSPILHVTRTACTHSCQSQSTAYHHRYYTSHALLAHTTVLLSYSLKSLQFLATGPSTQVSKFQNYISVSVTINNECRMWPGYVPNLMCLNHSVLRNEGVPKLKRPDPDHAFTHSKK